MILGKPAPFVSAFIDAVDDAIRAHQPAPSSGSPKPQPAPKQAETSPFPPLLFALLAVAYCACYFAFINRTPDSASDFIVIFESAVCFFIAWLIFSVGFKSSPEVGTIL